MLDAARPAHPFEPLATETARFQYLPVSPKDRGADRGRAWGEAAARVSAPVLGSRLIFPRIFARAWEAVASGRRPSDLNPAHACWYFGPHLDIRVNPASLHWRLSDYVSCEGESRWIGSGFLDCASWTMAVSPIAGSPVHREMRQLICNRLRYRSMPAYRVLLRRLRRGKLIRRSGILLDSRSSIDAYFEHCAALVESIRERGIVSRRALAAERRPASTDARAYRFDLSERDIGVAIGADGTLVRHLGGKHRTAIAQTLQLPTMPVRVMMVHATWLRNQIAATSLPPHLALIDGIRRLAAGHEGGRAA